LSGLAVGVGGGRVVWVPDDLVPDANVLSPASPTTSISPPLPPEWSRPAAIIFRDADGTWWLRDLLKQSLYRQSPLPRVGRVRRTLRRLEKEGRLTMPRQVVRGGHGHHAPW
jgi:hypothetical protein